MIAFIGDVHGKFRDLRALFSRYPELLRVEAVIQVGDFALFPDPRCAYVPPPRPIFWLDGNHEYYPEIEGLEEPTEVRENAIYVPRGTVLTLDGRNVGFLGGGDSRDRYSRTEGVDWFRSETISYEDMMRFPPDAQVDILATHTPPAHVIQLMIGPHAMDPSGRAVEAVWDGLGRPLCVSGHMHERRTIGRCEVLGELDVLFVP